MAIVAARLDNRLLHGIVQTQWAPYIAPSRIMVIDDKTADTPMLKEAMKMAKPSGMALSIINRETAYSNFKNGKYDQQKVFVIAKDPQIFLDLIQMGYPIPTLYIGGTAQTQESPESIKLSTRAVIQKSEVPIYDAIMESGTKAYVQYVPTDKSVPLDKLINGEQ